LPRFFSCLPKTPNLQHSTLNSEVASTFGVECSMLNVSGHAESRLRGRDGHFASIPSQGNPPIRNRKSGKARA
jgi:hypothetical protein